MPRALCGFNDTPGGVSGREALVQQGPTLFVDVGFDANFVPGGTSMPVPGRQNIGALVDTGATVSHIDAQLAAQLSLPIINRREIAGSNGRHMINFHLAQVRIPTLNHVVYGEFGAVDLAAGGQVHAVLLGRTFLHSYTMIYDGLTGTVTIYNSL